MLGKWDNFQSINDESKTDEAINTIKCSGSNLNTGQNINKI